MRKKLVLLFLLLLVLAGDLLGYAAYNAGALIEGNKQAIEAATSDALGATVALGGISAKIFPTVRLTIDGVTITNPDDKTERVRLDNVALHARLLPLLRRRLELKTLRFNGPKLVTLMEEEGPRIAGLPREVDDSNEPEALKLPFDLSFDHIKVNGATITLRYPRDGTEHVVAGLDLDATVTFDGRRAQLSSFSGDATVLDDVEVAYGGSGIDYALDTSVVAIDNVNATVLDSRFDLSGGLDTSNSSTSITIASNGVPLEELAPLYEKFAPIVNEWNIKGVARPDLNFRLTPGGYTATGTLAIADVAGTVFDIAVTGPVGSVSLNANQDRQLVESDSLAATLNDVPLEAEGKASLADGLLEQVNLAREFLTAIDSIPFVSDSLYQLVPERLRGELDRNYTILEGVEGTFAVAD
jgi:uncharacterized protein involved in outer membrane biogenesis